MGISLGKVNYYLRTLIDRGLLKASRFHDSRIKSGYGYMLTPKGIREKTTITAAILRDKLSE